MNGEIPSVPIITLAGVASLTNLLPELPLPTPLPHTVNKSLLYHPMIASEAQQFMASPNNGLVQQLASALRMTNTDHVELRDNLQNDIIDGEVPELLKAILLHDPDVFKTNPVYHGPGYNFVSHSELFPSGLRSLDEEFSSLQGIQTPMNGQLANYSDPSFGVSQQSTPSDFGCSMVNGTGRGVQQHLGDRSSLSGGNLFPSTVSSHQATTNFLPSVGSSQGSQNSSGSTARMPDCSPAQATAAPPLAGEAMLRASMQPAQYYDSNRNGLPGGRNDSSRLFDACQRDMTKAKVLIEPLKIEQMDELLKKSNCSKKSSFSNVPEEMHMLPRVSLTRIDDKKQKYRDAITRYNVIQSPESAQQLKIKLSKSRFHHNSRGTKRPHSDDEDDEPVYKNAMTMAQLQDYHGEFATSLTERVKRRRGKVSYRDRDDEDEDEPRSRDSMRGRDASRYDDDSQSDSSVMEAARRRKKERKQRRMMEVSGTVEELMETPTFKKFYTALDLVLDAADDMDLARLRDDEDDVDGGSMESIVPKYVVTDLCSEAAKLKSMGIMNQVPYEKLIKVLTILQYSIKQGSRLVPLPDLDGECEEELLLRELTVEQVQMALDAALVAMHIMTSSDMPKEVFLEDVIERIVRLTKMQLHNAVYPEFDPVYRIDPHNKSGVQSNSKLKRAKSSGAKDRTTLLLYNKLTDLTLLLAELIEIQELTDTIILQTSSLAVSPFFVENIPELQLNSLKLVTNIFSKYDKHRQLILEDILSSLARLPSSKKNLRSYRLNADEQIQMVTALALQLIQCVVKLPQLEDDQQPEEPEQVDSHGRKKKKEKVDNEVMILTSYETAMRTAHNFLYVFLAKCTAKGEDDYRSLFENFVYDLLATVNKPEWPAAELILSLLGNLLVKQFSCKSVEMSLRVASLDYLGIVAARLRKDAVSSHLNEDVISEIMARITDSDDGESSKSRRSAQNSEANKTETLQKGLLQYLVYSSENDPALIFSRQFYIAQWYRDCTMEIEKTSKRLAEEKKNEKKNEKRRRAEAEDDDDDDEDDEEKEDKAAKKVEEELELLKTMQQRVEQRKMFLMEQISVKVGAFSNFKPSQSKLDYENALLTTRYLASNRPFSQSFDIYLTQILKVLRETAVAVRSKALKCLTAVIEADPAVLARNDMQMGVHCRFLDQSTSVREAAIELVGKFLLVCPELTTQYYDMLSERILDTGISVRKRVIKIFRDICIEQPDFPKIPEMCVKMIRRVNDEEGIRKLVNDTFQNMWFTPVRDKDNKRLLQKVMNITDVVAACHNSGFDWLEQLMDNLLKKEEDTKDKPMEKACVQIVDCLVENVLQLEEKAAEFGRASSPRLVSCFSTLYLFCKVKPSLLVPHCTVIQPYLDIKCTAQGDVMLLNNVARILELSLPLMDHPSESFLAQLEEDMTKLIFKHGMTIVQSCVSCLGAVVKDLTHNFKLVYDCFEKFYGHVSKLSDSRIDPKSQVFASNKPTLQRALFTVGLLCKQFDFDSEDFTAERKIENIREHVFSLLLHFVSHPDEEVQLKALTGLGFLVTRHYEFMLGKELRDFYHHLLTDASAPVRMCCQVLQNLKTYLLEEEDKMARADAEWRKIHDKEDLKELGDVQSGMASTIIQVYLKQVLESFLHSESQVRLSALEVVVLILNQGLVHPQQCMPYLICMGSDNDPNIRLKADRQLQEIDKKYPGFIQARAMHGIKMSCRLQKFLQQSQQNGTLRGVRVEDNNLIALNYYIYSIIRNNRGNRRALLMNSLKMFEDKTPLNELVFMADNLAYFPYQQQDEPLYIIHQIDIILSVSGCNLLQSFREVFYPAVNPENGESGATGENGETEVKDTRPDEDDEDLESLLPLVPEDATTLNELYMSIQGCLLLLVLKQHLKEMYGFTDNKIQRYSPTDVKSFEKPVNRKNGVKFNPKDALELLNREPLPAQLDEDGKKEVISAYLNFKELMQSIDPDDNDDDLPATNPSTVVLPSSTSDDPNASGDVNGTPSLKISVPSSGLNFKHRHNTPLHKHTSERRRGRPSGSTPRPPKLPKSSSKHKKKKRRYNASDSEADSDDGESDPDWG